MCFNVIFTGWVDEVSAMITLIPEGSHVGPEEVKYLTQGHKANE